jgi:hypothetical protein
MRRLVSWQSLINTLARIAIAIAMRKKAETARGAGECDPDTTED